MRFAALVYPDHINPDLWHRQIYKQVIELRNMGYQIIDLPLSEFSTLHNNGKAVNTPALVIIDSNFGTHGLAKVTYLSGKYSTAYYANYLEEQHSYLKNPAIKLSGQWQEGAVIIVDLTNVETEIGDSAYELIWYRDYVKIDGASQPSYTLTQLDVGAHISVEISYPGGSFVSPPSVSISNINDVPQGDVLRNV